MIEPGSASAGALHIMAKRGDLAAARWLLDHGADPNAGWSHWDSVVTPLHLAVLGNHPTVVRVLLEAKADPRIRDTKHDSDALGWAEFFGRTEISRMLEAHVAIS
jgi:ankyrin repeat protein